MRRIFTRRSYVTIGVLLAAAALTAVEPNQNIAPSAVAAATSTSSPVKHVVIIYEENHSFDDVLGAVCKERSVRCNGYTGPVTLANGVTVQNRVGKDVVPDAGHSPWDQEYALANKWNLVNKCDASHNYACITHYAPSGIPNLARLANTYAVSDATYALDDDSSFGAHVQLGAGTDDGFWGTNPQPSKTGAAPLPGWGCASHKDARWTAAGSTKITFQPSCVPQQDGTGAYRSTPVPYRKSIMEQLEGAGLSWRIYNGSSATPRADGLWNVCSYFAWCVKHRQNATYNPGWPAFETAATNGTLPAVAMIPASGNTSQHNGNSMLAGDNYIGSLVQAVMNGPEWKSTAIFITYDDCGCFYDHVKPPHGLGLRNPMVIVSPWAKRVFTDSTTAIQPYSMLAFIDHNFGLPALTSAVGNAYDYRNSFDFTGASLSTRTPTMVHSHVSKATKAQVRRLRHLWSKDIT